jgi:O-antigen/teichoic acid export membrane protein
VSISGLNFTAITAMGNTGWRVGLEALVAVVTLVAIVVALPYGIVAVAWAYAASYYLLLPFQLWAVVRLLPITTWPYLRQHLPAVLCAVPMVGAIIGLRSLLLDRLDGPALLAVLIILGVFVYCGTLFLVVPARARQTVSTFRLALENAQDRDEIGYESMLG